MTTKVRPAEAEALAALDRGRYDIEVFCREVLGIAPNAAQQRWFRYVNPAEDGWNWRIRRVIHVAANQIGKTVGIAILILWACNYKIGVPSPAKGASDAEYRDWGSRPYTWFHLAPSQQQAYIPLDDIVLLAQGVHPAQEKGREYGLKCRWLPGLCSETKVEQYYRGLTFWSGAVCQFRTTEDKAKALQGRRAAGISFDEAAFEDHLKSILNEALMMRLVAMGGPLFPTSTPNGINDFYELVQQITHGAEVQPWSGVPTDHNPEERVWQTELGVVTWSVVDDNVGFGLTREFVDDQERDLDESTKEQQLRGAFLEPAEAFFTPASLVLAAFIKSLPDLQQPQPGHVYVIAWDPSVSSDPTAGVVIDVTKEPWIGVAVTHYKKPLGINELIQKIWATHALFNSATDPRNLVAQSRAITCFDETSMGGKIIRQMLAGLHPLRPINFGGPSAKLSMLTNLRAALVGKKVDDKHRPMLLLPDSWMSVRRELLTYRLKDDKLRQDLVMALAMAADVAARGFSGATRAPFSVQGRVSQSPMWR